MPAEAKKFQGVDGLWRETLARITEAPAVLPLGLRVLPRDRGAGKAACCERLDELLRVCWLVAEDDRLMEAKGVEQTNNLDQLRTG